MATPKKNKKNALQDTEAPAADLLEHNEYVSSVFLTRS